MTGPFADRHIGTDAAAQRTMLDALGYDSVDALVEAAVPASIRSQPRATSDIPPAATEAELEASTQIAPVVVTEQDAPEQDRLAGVIGRGSMDIQSSP